MRNVATVAVLFPARVSHLESSVHGIADYARQNGGWTFVMQPESYSVTIQNLGGWHGDGVIALIDTESDAHAAQELRVPVVNLSGALCDPGIPRVMVDHAMVGRMAAEHLLQCGFRRFGYYGIDNLWHTELRKRGFVERVEQEKCDCDVFTMDYALNEDQPWCFGCDELEQWLSTLAVPTGVLACDDYRARMVVDACARLELDVPDEVGVIGIDNEELICEFCVPQLSSVSRSNYEVGFQAASLLNRLMHGEPPPGQDILIPPDGIVQRQSTNIVGVNDPNVAAAVRFIRENLDKKFGIKQVAAQVSVSRRCLEQGFQTQLGCTPYEYLLKLRVERAKQLLSGQERMKINHVARECGFNNPLQLRRAFCRVTGITPQKYRDTSQ